MNVLKFHARKFGVTKFYARKFNVSKFHAQKILVTESLMTNSRALLPYLLLPLHKHHIGAFVLNCLLFSSVAICFLSFNERYWFSERKRSFRSTTSQVRPPFVADVASVRVLSYMGPIKYLSQKILIFAPNS